MVSELQAILKNVRNSEVTVEEELDARGRPGYKVHNILRNGEEIIFMFDEDVDPGKTIVMWVVFKGRMKLSEEVMKKSWRNNQYFSISDPFVTVPAGFSSSVEILHKYGYKRVTNQFKWTGVVGCGFVQQCVKLKDFFKNKYEEGEAIPVIIRNNSYKTAKIHFHNSVAELAI